MSNHQLLLFSSPFIWIVAGCISTDPSRELDRSADLVTERSGVPTAWRVDGSGAVEWRGDSPLSARDAVVAALASNRELRLRIESIVGARAELARAGLLPNPIVALGYGLPIDSGGGTALAGALIAQLADLWKRPARVAEADAKLRAEVLATSDAALRLVAEVRVAHARLLHEEKALRLHEERVRRAREYSEADESAFLAGTTRLDERNRSLELVLEAERRVEKRKATVDGLRRELLELMGMAGADSSFVIEGEDAVPGADSTLDENELAALAASQRLDVRAALASTEAGDEKVLLASLSRIPRVTARVGAERNLEGREGLFPGGEVELPIFDPGSVAVAGALSNQRAARLRAEAAVERAVLEVRRAFVSLGEARAIEASTRRPALELATANSRAALAAFEAGVASRAEWLRTEIDRLEAASDLETARGEIAASYFELERAAGGRIEP